MAEAALTARDILTPQPERAETRSSPSRAHSYRAFREQGISTGVISSLSLSAFREQEDD